MRELISPTMDPDSPGVHVAVPPPGATDLTSLKAIELEPNKVSVPDAPTIDEEMRGAVINEMV